MNDSDLESRLQSLRVPERNEDFWDAFPERVMAKLRSVPTRSVFPSPRLAGPPRKMGLGWTTGLTLACLAFGICLGRSQTPKVVAYALLKDEIELRHTVRQFPNRVRTLMQDEHGLHKLVEDQP